MADMVYSPKHYTSHPSGIECIQIAEHMGFNLGNALKYVWRADLKNDALEDLEKARWYISREIELRTKQVENTAKMKEQIDDHKKLLDDVKVYDDSKEYTLKEAEEFVKTWGQTSKSPWINWPRRGYAWGDRGGWSGRT